MAGRSDQEMIDTYEATVRGLYAAVCRQTGSDRALAEDIVQETYLRALRAWRRQGLPRSPAAWLRTVARNLLVSHYRQAGREIPADVEDTEEAPPEPVVARLTMRRGLQELGGMPERLLRGFHLEGRSVGEIAAETRLSERAVEGRLRRARRALAMILTHPGTPRSGS